MSLPLNPHLAYIGPGAGFAFLGSFLTLLGGLLLGLISVLLWPFRIAWGALTGRQGYKNAKIKKLIFLGLDGLDPSLADRYMAAGTPWASPRSPPPSCACPSPSRPKISTAGCFPPCVRQTCSARKALSHSTLRTPPVNPWKAGIDFPSICGTASITVKLPAPKTTWRPAPAR